MRLDDESGARRDATPAGGRDPEIREYPVREYRYAATDATLEALRLLRGAWAGYAVAEGGLAVRLADGAGVRVGADGAVFQGVLEAFRVAAAPLAADELPPARDSDFGGGGNEVVLFQSEAWIEPAAERGVTRRSGRPGMRGAGALAVAMVSDALLVASPHGSAVLVRCGEGVLDVTESREEIAPFMEERGYGA